jgi:hypothetical protein
MVREGLLFVLVGSSCVPDSGDDRSRPASTPPSLAKTAEPDEQRSSPDKAKADVAPSVKDARPLGWWRSSSVCLELFDNGDFELSSRGRGPKVLVMGRVEEVESTGREQTLRLAVKRIWRTRWATPCQKFHEFGTWADEEKILGHTFSPDSVASVTVERLGDDGLRLCAEACIELKKETPKLGGRWRRPEGSDTELVELVAA